MARKPALQLPFVREPAERVELGIFRKQILPVGNVESEKYGTLKFDRERLRGVVDRFKAGAYDMVPLLLADKDGGHHDDLERIQGEVDDLELTDEGLFARIKTSAAGSKLLREFPRLPVSVRLVPDENGEALGHVLATPEPVWRGQRSWELIEASDDRPVIDLSAKTIHPSDEPLVIPEAGHGRPAGDMPDTDTDTPVFTQDHADTLDALGKALKARADAAADDKPPDDKPSDDDEAARLLAQLLAGSDEDDDEADEDADRTPETAGVSMSAEDRAALELAKRRAENADKRTAKLERDLAKERFKNEREQFLKDGVPPVLVELATPVLTAPQMEPIELAGGTKVSPQETVRKMLAASKGLIEFSEIGNGDGGDGDGDREQAKEIAKALSERFDG